MARAYPQAHCPRCGASLARVDFPAKHLDRCERLASAATDVVAEQPTRPAVSFLRRLIDRTGIYTRGAAE